MRTRKLIRQIMSHSLPKPLRHHLLRDGIRLNWEPSSHLKLRLARTQEELTAAFTLLHDCYVHSGFMNPHPSGMRVTKYHALPATSTLIALWDNEVVGTVSLIRRSAFGLPMQNIFDLSDVTEKGFRVVEVSALAVRKDFSGKRGEILFPLCKFLYEYSRLCFGTDYFSIAVNPSWMDFYQAILLFQRIPQKVAQNYSFVNGAPAVGGLLSLNEFAQDSKRVFLAAEFEKNIYSYFHHLHFPGFEFPERRFAKINDPVLTPELIDYFFNQRTRVFDDLTETEIFVLRQLYKNDEFARVLPNLPRSIQRGAGRSEPRFDVKFEGEIKLPGGHSIPLTVTSAARSGLGVISQRELREDEVYELRIRLSDTEWAHQRVKIKWSSPNKRLIGMQILSASENWYTLINLMQQDLFRIAA